METIKTRFEKQFPNVLDGEEMDGGNYVGEKILAFIAQELTLVAETVEKEVQNNNSHDWDVAIEHAAAIIRAHV